MQFENKYLLWLLLVIPPAIVLLFWLANRQKQKLLAQFVSARLLPVLTTGISPARQKLRFAFLIFAVAFLIVALARPQYGFDLEEVQQNGLDIVVAIDTSKSMLTTDIAPNRLERAKLAALELMQRAGTDRMGLVAFAGDAFLECPLTIDNTAFQQSVQALNVNSIPQGGTAIAGAIQTAATAFKENDAHKVLVLLTDGEDNDSETGALAAAQNAAKKRGRYGRLIRVSSIHVRAVARSRKSTRMGTSSSLLVISSLYSRVDLAGPSVCFFDAQATRCHG